MELTLRSSSHATMTTGGLFLRSRSCTSSSMQTRMNPPRGLDLPTVSADKLRSCTVRLNSSTLLGCALLLPAGTGTQSLHDFMKMSVRHARMSVDDPPPHPLPSTHTNLKYVHHLHHVRMTSWSAPRVRPVPKCFIMSLRDPAAPRRVAQLAGAVRAHSPDVVSTLRPHIAGVLHRGRHKVGEWTV